MEMEKIIDKLEFLEEWILHIDSDVKFHMTMQWTLIGVIVAIVGVALVYIAKGLFQDTVKKELRGFKEEIISEVSNYRIIRVSRCALLSGVQIISHPGKINAIIIKAYFEDGRKTDNCKITKDTLMYSENGVSRDNIKIKFSNGGTSEVRVKRLIEKGFELEWFTDGEVEDVNVGLDIMIF